MNKQILITEDSKAINKALAIYLSEIGNYTIHRAHTLKEAEQVLFSINIDFLLLDLTLPDGDGELLIDKIGQCENLQTRIIVLTSSEDVSRREKLFQKGVLDHFLKTSRLEFIALEIHKLISRIEQNSESRILIVDDSKSACLMLGQVLEERGFQIAMVHDGEEALTFLEKQPVDLLVLDLEMPKKHGEEVLYEIRKEDSYLELPVIVLSATRNRDLIARVLKNGANDFIQKPYSMEEVILKVDMNLRLARAEQELMRINRDLERRVAEETQKRRDSEQLLIQQSKMADMGQLVGIIAHQWKQPINAIYLLIQNLKEAHLHGELDLNYMEESVDKAASIIHFMSQTVDDFRTFFRPSREKVTFDVRESVRKVLNILQGVLYDRSIKVEITNPDFAPPPVCGYKTEFEQVILNIVNNAKDAIYDRIKRGEMESDAGRIIITFAEEKDTSLLFIADNGGGIPEAIIDRIFDSYFTTKGEDKGTGIGLYMAKTIIENNMGGKLEVANAKEGAVFSVYMKSEVC